MALNCPPLILVTRPFKQLFIRQPQLNTRMPFPSILTKFFKQPLTARWNLLCAFTLYAFWFCRFRHYNYDRTKSSVSRIQCLCCDTFFVCLPPGLGEGPLGLLFYAFAEWAGLWATPVALIISIRHKHTFCPGTASSSVSREVSWRSLTIPFPPYAYPLRTAPLENWCDGCMM